MPGQLTVLWLVDHADVPEERDGRFRHVTGNPERPAAIITSLLSEGAVLAIVRSEEEAERAISYGADETVLASDLAGELFERAVSRTAARAQARLHRDLFLIDIVRKDDTTALELLAAALGEELSEPLARASLQSKELAGVLKGEAEPALRASALAETFASAAGVVNRMKELVSTERTDEVVDLVRVAREVATALAPAVHPVAAFDVTMVEQACLVALPRWQVAMAVASLVENAVQSVAARAGGGRRVSLRVDIEDEAAILEVEDDGVGMDDDERAFAMDPFFTTTGKGHLGLGLTLVSARVRRAGGSLIIDSDPGVGTIVRVFLPLVGPRGGSRTSN